ncbi:twin-arginine translocase subunit TatC [Mariniblastus fucicola]|uniref:Sec-independent protein translocase protein TatC n=1 Tax=Mariniblastus fucicola TaxID=980251 RepID=A0A5B9PEG0_9BACT|nr:twin-arginine translocase subunit TatC [Mariniblastus fucicola]QEG24624.1 Sec-independent protein translocase protein TatCy [Mariniblastus fucicola]
MSFRNSDDDLFEESRMSFGQHLEELRWVLVKCLIALAIGCCIGFYFAENVVKQLKVPLRKALDNYELVEAKDQMVSEQGYIDPDLAPWMDESRYVPQKGLVDPVEILKLLQSISPDIGEKVELNPYLFSAVDFDRERLKELSGRLANQTADANSDAAQLKAVWSRIPKATQIKIADLAKKSEVNGADVGLLVDAFNVVAGKDLHSDAAFSEQLAEPDQGLLARMFSKPVEKPLARMKTYLRENSKDEAANRQLNRALVHSLFQNQLPPLKRALGELTMWVPLNNEPQSLAPTDGFLIWLKAGLITGLLVALPAIIWFLWTFVAAGLYPHEQKYVYIFLPVSLALFFAGVCLAFFFVFAPVLDFLFSFNKAMGIAPQMRINDWLSFVMFLPLGFGVAFQLPLVMLFVNRIGLISVEAYIEKWRIAVMAISVLSMLLTPADPISMVLMAAPLTLLYFLGIGMCKWMPAPTSDNPFDEATV